MQVSNRGAGPASNPGAADGAEFDALPGDVTALPQGHDAWVVGDEPVVVVDWYGASSYARLTVGPVGAAATALASP
jgi:hypothetical protein